MTPTCPHCDDYRERIAKLEATVAEQQLLFDGLFSRRPRSGPSR